MKVLIALFLSISFLNFNYGIDLYDGPKTTAELKGQLLDSDDQPIGFVNVALYLAQNGSLAKVEVTDEEGRFSFSKIKPGVYNLEASFVGFTPLKVEAISLIENQQKDLGSLKMVSDAVELEGATVTAKRVMVEVKPDRTVFNVEGTINSAGENGLGLLRKAPGVLVDNNNNISVMSRSGVLIYVDGKRLPINGDALTNYLQNLPAEQIDRIDIITNPGAKYEAEGNAGIIDIRLKKDKTIGANGSASSNVSQGRYATAGGSLSGNYRNKKLNIFATLGLNAGTRYNDMDFINFQNNLVIDEYNFTKTNFNDRNVRFGTDFFVAKNHTVGFLVTGGVGSNSSISDNFSTISTGLGTPIDSILIANNETERTNDRLTFNVNYAWNNGKKSLNIDADYGTYNNDADFFQPNLYYDQSREQLLSSNITSYTTPTQINIATFKVDYEVPLLKGTVGVGTKLSNVGTTNEFLFNNIINEEVIFNNQRSNTFDYSETVYAGYVNYATNLSKKIGFSAGVRTEVTDVIGDLEAFDVSLNEDPISQFYTNYFPTVGLTYQLKPMQSLSLNFGSRINRPDYNVLNPFRVQMSELSFSKGNAFLLPERVYNAELGYTLFYRFNFKLGYSKTYDQITRLIAPDDEDPRAGFITWANLAEQEVFSFNASLPFQITDWWSLYLNANASQISNKAEYDNGGIVDVQVFNYSFFQQQTFELPNKFTAEISGWYSGPGVWGGVFLYDPQWSLNLGLQRKFLNDKMNVKLSVNDIFFQSGWTGESSFNGLVSSGRGNWDSRRAALAVSYNFGNSNIKSRRRKTGLEDESKRVGN